MDTKIKWEAESDWGDALDAYGTLWLDNSKTGDLVRLQSWTKYPNQVGQIIGFESDESVKILIAGQVKGFLKIDYERIF